MASHQIPAKFLFFYNGSWHSGERTIFFQNVGMEARRIRKDREEQGKREKNKEKIEKNRERQRRIWKR
jgi:hypothetical protein